MSRSHARLRAEHTTDERGDELCLLVVAVMRRLWQSRRYPPTHLVCAGYDELVKQGRIR